MTDTSAIYPIPEDSAQSTPAEDALIERLGAGRGRKYARLVIAALSSIPWVGGVLGASASFSAEQDQEKLNELQRLWLQGHRAKVRELAEALQDIATRLDGFGEEIQERVTSDEYLALVTRTFRSWDQADTQEKRRMFQRLITNAGATTLCPDDLVRLFIGWMDLYHEAHFLVIRAVFQHPGITRGGIWDLVHPGARPREDSSEADLFRYLMRDLSTGGVLRQERDTDAAGNFLKKTPQRSRSASGSPASRVTESAFENTKPYELTELGKQFVHYPRGTPKSGQLGTPENRPVVRNRSGR